MALFTGKKEPKSRGSTPSFRGLINYGPVWCIRYCQQSFVDLPIFYFSVERVVLTAGIRNREIKLIDSSEWLSLLVTANG